MVSNERTISIIRVAESVASIYGEVFLDEELICLSMELPWRGNQNEISSIPAGAYAAILRQEKERDHGFTIELQAVPKRTNVQLHVGNVPKDSVGCVLLGNRAVLGKNKIQDSRNAVLKLKEAFYGDKPVSPDVSIRVIVADALHALRYTFENGTYLEFFEGHWLYRDGNTTLLTYPEVLRDTRFIIVKGDPNGRWNGQYLRWPLGGGEFQLSKDLKGWGTFTDGKAKRTPPLRQTFTVTLYRSTDTQPDPYIDGSRAEVNFEDDYLDHPESHEVTGSGPEQSEQDDYSDDVRDAENGTPVN